MEIEEKIAVAGGLVAIGVGGYFFWRGTKKPEAPPPEGGVWASEGTVLAKTPFGFVVAEIPPEGGVWRGEGLVLAMTPFEFVVTEEPAGGWFVEGEVLAKEPFEFIVTEVPAEIGFTLKLRYCGQFFIGEKYWSAWYRGSLVRTVPFYLGIDDTWDCPSYAIGSDDLHISIYDADYHVLWSGDNLGPVYDGRDYVFDCIKGKIVEI